ncbi:MAG: SHOCT domain-containing protein [Actinomycetota bacterium]
MWGYGHGWGLGGGGMGFGFVFWLAILTAIIALVVWFSRSGPLDRSQRRSSGLEVLEQRYARGEISREEYLEKKRDITG